MNSVDLLESIGWFCQSEMEPVDRMDDVFKNETHSIGCWSQKDVYDGFQIDLIYSNSLLTQWMVISYVERIIFWWLIQSILRKHQV